MPIWPPPFDDPTYLAYVAVFGAAALACLAGAWRARKVESPDVRRGLIGLLGASGLWAGAHVGMLLASSPFLKARLYEAGLVVGFATVWAWLYFCSAYSGRSLHRSRTARAGALLLFGTVTLTKLTGPWHGLYFSAQILEAPFPHLSVDHHVLYWGIAALSYELAAVGFFMLYEPLRRMKMGSAQLAGLFGLTVLPMAANALGYASPWLLDVGHEPLGIAAFTIGVLFVYGGWFEEVGKIGRSEKPVLVLSGTVRVQNYNEQAATLFPQLETQEAIGSPLSEVLPDVAEALSAGTEEGGPWKKATVVQVEQGEATRHYRPGELRLESDLDRRGLQHQMVVLDDVTERKQEQKLRLLARALEEVDNTVVIADREGRIQYVNEAFEQATGYAEEEVLGKTSRVFQSDEYGKEFYEEIWETILSGETFRGDITNVRKDGTPYTSAEQIAPITDGEGAITHFVSTGRDVTEDREREERLRRQKSLLEQTQRLAGAWMADLRTGELSWSEEGHRIHERDPGTELSLEEAFEFPHPQARSKVRQAFERCTEEGEPYDVEHPIVTAEGEKRWVRTVGAPVEEEDGEIVKVAGAFQDITERKEAEEELRRSREQLSMAVEGGNIGTWNWDLETDEVTFNRRWAEMLGYSREELDFDFSTWEELVHPEDLPRAMKVLETYLEGETGTYDPEIRMRTKSGEWKWIQTIGKVVEREAGGAVTRAAGIHLDIDERRRAEEELRRSRERYRSLFENSTDAILVHDLEDRIQEANPQAEALFGREAGELEGQSVRDLHAPEEQETAREKLAALRSGNTYQAVSRYERADGSTFWGEISASVTDAGDETVVRTLIRDVTEREESRRQLERYRKYTDRLLNAIDDFFFVLDEEAQLERWNGRVPEVTGYSGEEIGEMSALDFVRETERERVAEEITEAFTTGSGRIEVPLLRKDGTTVPYEFAGNLVAHPEGGLRVVGIGRDITERRRRKQRLERQNDLFERAQEIANVGAWEYDVQREKSMLTDQAYRIHGLAPGGDLTPERSLEFFHPDDRPVVREAFREAIEEGESYDIEVRLITEVGEKRWVRTRGEPQREDGEVVRIRGTIQDITEQKAREQRAERARKKYEGILEGAPDAVFVADAESGEIVETNRAAAELLETSLDQIVGRHHREFYPPGEQDRVQTLMEKTRQSRGPMRMRTYGDGEQIYLETFSGKQVPVEISATTVEVGDQTFGIGISRDISARLERRRELEQAETLFQSAQDALFLIDVDHADGEPTFTVQQVNPAYEATTGLSGDVLLGKSPREVIGGEAARFMEAQYRACVDRQEPLEYEEEVPLEGGMTYWETRIAPVRVEGTVEKIVGSTRDVTERRNREEQLRQTSARLEALFERSPDMIDVHDPDGTIVTSNARLREETGYSEEELAGMKVWELDRSIDPEEIRELWSSMAVGEKQRLEGTYWCRDGTTFPVEVHIRRLDLEGTEQFVAISHDITERKQREERLRRRRQMVESLYDATERLLRVESREDVSDRIHEVVGEVFGYPLGHTGFVDEGIVVPERTEATEDLRMPRPEPHPTDRDTVVSRALQAGEAVVVERTDALDNDIDYGDVRSAAGVPIGEWGALVVGKTRGEDFNRLELHLLEVLGSYAALVLDRLDREETLVEAKEAAEKANRVKSVFLANMSHEIRTPLTSILGFAEAIGEEVRTADDGSAVDLSTLRRFARLIENSGERLMETLTGVLNLSKLEAGEMELDLEPVDLSAEAAQVAEELRPQAEEKGLGFQIESGDVPVWARADAGGVQIVVRNLVSNAIKYTEDGGVVRVRTYREEDAAEDENAAVVEVEDTGIGMDPAAMEDLFDPFRQESEGISRDYEGTGLGLAVTRKALWQMEGTIEVETEKGEGTCITVRLPRADDAQEASGARKA